MELAKREYFSKKLDKACTCLTRNIWITGCSGTGKTTMIQNMTKKQIESNKDTLFIDQDYLLSSEKIMIANDLLEKRMTEFEHGLEIVIPVILVLDDYRIFPDETRESIRKKNQQLTRLIEQGRKYNLFVWGTSQVNSVGSHHISDLFILAKNRSIDLIELNVYLTN